MPAQVAMPVSIQRARPLLGTTVAIRIEMPEAHTDPAHTLSASAAIDAAFSAVADVHARMSVHDPQSELSCLNREAVHRPVHCSRPLLRVLRAAQALARASNGWFDASIGAHLVESGHLPRPEDAPTPDLSADWRDIECLASGCVRFHKPLWLDFGGIAKGYAVDCAVAVLHAHGIRSGIVNAGGDLRVFGSATETIFVRDYGAPTTCSPLLQLCDGAAATSAGYFSTREGRTALIDPRIGMSIDKKISVTVSAPRALWADALTKIVLIDPDAAVPILRRLHAQAAIIDGSRSIRILQ